MDVISEEYRKVNQDLHESRPSYGAGGHRWADYVGARCEEHFWSVLDYGCGKGTLSQALQNTLTEYDPAIPGKHFIPPPRRFVICTDVLEHIEPERLDDVLKDIKRCTMKEALLVVATRPANKKLPDGRNAHLIIEPWEWWRERISKYFDIQRHELDVTQKGEIAAWCTPKRFT